MKKLVIYKRKFIIELLISLVVIAGVLLYLEKEEEVFLRDFRYFILARIEKELDMKISIQRMDGGFFDNITMKKIKITKQLDEKTTLVFEADSIDVYYRLWAIAIDKAKFLKLLKRFVHTGKDVKVSLQNAKFYFAGSRPFVDEISGSMVIREHSIKCDTVFGKFWNIPVRLSGEIFNSYDNPGLDINLSFVKEPVKGIFHISEHLREPVINGTISINNKDITIRGKLISKNGILNIEQLLISNNMKVDGYFDFIAHMCQLNIEIQDDADFISSDTGPGRIKVSFDFARLPYAKVDIRLEHLKVGNIDIVSNLTLKSDLKIASSRIHSIKSELITSATIINFKPFKEIEAFFEFSQSVFRIVYFKLGDAYNISGKIDFNKPPYEMNLTLYFNKAELNELAILSGASSKDTLPGIVSGKINFSGALNRISTKGDVVINDGLLGSIKYNSMAVELEGVGPIIDIKEARLLMKDGAKLILDGKIDLSRIGAGNPIQYLQLKSDQANVILAGFDITKDPSSAQVSISRSIGEDFRINFSTMAGKDETVFGKDASRKNEVEENESFFSLEHKSKF